MSDGAGCVQARRTAPDAAKYNVGGTSKLGDWEISGMIDISEQTGEIGIMRAVGARRRQIATVYV